MKTAAKSKRPYSKKSKCYTCPCGHVFFECQCNGFCTNIQANCNECKVNPKRCQCNCKQSNTELGDISKKVKETDLNNLITNNTINQIETIVKYQNKNYTNTESKSSTESSLSSKCRTSTYERIRNSGVLSLEEKPIQRTVICPVSACGILIAMDSVTQHFCFDHSKIPRIIWKNGNIQEIILKPSNFSYATSCLAIFFLKYKRWNDLQVVSLNPINGNSKPVLLLMGATIENKESSCKISNSNILKSYTTQLNGSKVYIKNNSYKRNDSRKVTFCFKDNDQISKNSEFVAENDIILWICSLNMDNIVYSITLFREDKKLGHSYIGESIGITESQHPVAMYQRGDCLIVRGLSATKLQNECKQINAIVNILD